ncbi:hypothetical protein K469DRAFT_530788, partial [Zopfia rhizophila CBS 207.26]
ISLRAVSTVHALYKSLPQTTIPLNMANSTISEARWIPENDAYQDEIGMSHENFALNLSEQFSCILYIESGGFDVESDSFEGVMAMSSGNSLYIPKCLLGDLWENKREQHQMQRIIGNIGRPGFSMMVSPQNVRMREIEDDKWVMVNHHPFDGKNSDCFQQTTLHLSFTDYVMPIDVGDHGKRDAQVYFLEAAVSVHDRGEWVGDIDVLRSLASPKLQLIRAIRDCKKKHTDQDILPSRFSQFLTIENWEELIDSPQDAAVVRASGNWQARLAAASLGIQRGHTIRLLSRGICWPC